MGLTCAYYMEISHGIYSLIDEISAEQVIFVGYLCWRYNVDLYPSFRLLQDVF